MTRLLEVDDLVVRYGNVKALHGVSLHADADEIVAILGRNGAGKTTLLRTIFGFVRPVHGAVRFAGDTVTRWPPHRLGRHGVAYVPEERGIFVELSVVENLRLGAIRADGDSDKMIDRVYELFPPLRESARRPAGTLSGGQQQMLGIGRALMAGPRLLLLDEPSLGLAPRVLGELFAAMTELASRGLTILLVEQNVHRALSIASRGYVLDLGRIALEGSPAEILEHPRLQSAYLSASRGPRSAERRNK